MRGKLPWCFGLDRKFLSSFPWICHMANAINWIQPVDQLYYGRATPRSVSQKQRYHKPERRSVPASSSGEGDVSEIGSNKDACLAQLHLRKEASGLSSYEGPHVTTAPSECLDLSDYEMELPETNNCRLQTLWLEKELAIRRWKKNCAKKKEALMAQALQSAFKFMGERHKKSEEAGNAEAVQDVVHQKLQQNMNFSDTLSDEDDRIALETLNRVEKLQKFSEKVSQTPNEAGKLQHISQNRKRALQRCLEKLQEDLKRSEVAFYLNNDFAREALKKLEQVQSFSRQHNELLCNQEDPAQALQEKLENLLLVIHSLSSFEHKEKEIESSMENHERLMDKRAGTGVTNENANRTQSLFLDEKKSVFDIAALKRQLHLLSLGLSETKHIAGFIGKQYWSLLRRNRTKRRRQACKRHVGEGGKDLVAEEVKCKEAIRQIAVQVQAETEQWSRMQEILHHVKDELEELHQARDLLEERALHAEARLISLQEAAYEWRVRAEAAEEHVRELECETNKLENKVEKVQYRHALEKKRWLKVESQLKNALTSPLLTKNPSEQLDENRQQQKQDDSVRSSRYEDGERQHEWDKNRNIWTLKASKSHRVSHVLMQPCHCVEYEAVLNNKQKVFTSGESECLKPFVGTDINKKVGEEKENNLGSPKRSKKGNGQSQADSAIHDEDDDTLLVHSLQRMPFVEIRNLGSN